MAAVAAGAGTGAESAPVVASNSVELKYTRHDEKDNSLSMDVEKMGNSIVATVSGVSIQQLQISGKTFIRQDHGYYRAADDSFYFFNERAVQEIVVDRAASGAGDPHLTLNRVPKDVKETALRAIDALINDGKLLDGTHVAGGGPTRGDVADRAKTLRAIVADDKSVIDKVRLVIRTGTFPDCYAYFKMGYYDVLRGRWIYVAACSNDRGFTHNYSTKSILYENGMKGAMSRSEVASINSQKTES